MQRYSRPPGTNGGAQAHPNEVLLIAPAGLMADGLLALLPRLGDKVRGLRADSVAAAARVAVAKRLMLALIDIDGRERNMIQTIHHLHKWSPVTPIVVLSGEPSPALAQRALNAGALGFIPKDSSGAVLLSAIRLIMVGGRYVPPLGEGAHAWVNGSHHGAGAGRPGNEQDSAEELGLTERQVQVLSFIARGHTNKQIAAALKLSDKTIKVHVSNIFTALHVPNRSAAAIAALRIPEVSARHVQEAAAGKLSVEWLLPMMQEESYPAGHVLFNKGDASNQLYYLEQGAVMLEEIDVTMGLGTFFGEIGLFAQDHRRTCTARCLVETELRSMTSEKVMQIYLQNAQFALFLVQLITQRLQADAQRS